VAGAIAVFRFNASLAKAFGVQRFQYKRRIKREAKLMV
jgi:hypothetical protein